MRSNRGWDLLFVAGWAIASLVLLQLALPTWVKTLLAVPWVLGLTGYVITAAIFPRQQLGKAARLLFVITLSCAASALGGLVLNLTREGLRRDNWLVYLCAVTLAACAIGLVRRWLGARRAPTQIYAPVRLFITLKQLAQGGLFACAGLIAIAAIVMARIPPAPAEGLKGYTLLWMLPPGTGKNTDAQAARVGVHSAELSPTQYRLQVQQAGNIVQEWSLQLQPGEQWESEAIVIPHQTSQPGQANEPVKALLYRTDVPSVIYRQVAYWPNKPAENQTLEAK